MVFLDPHLGAGIDGIQEPLADIGVRLERKIVRGRALLHQECIRQHIALLVAELVLVFHRVHDDPVEQFEDRTVYGVLDAVPLFFFMTSAIFPHRVG